MLHLVQAEYLSYISVQNRPDYQIGEAVGGGPVFLGWFLDTDREQRAGALLHKFMGADHPDKFHSHEGVAFRLILKGGYTEQLPDGTLVKWKAGDYGFVTPDFVHRVHSIDTMNIKPVTLWLKGPSTHPVKRIGKGWGDREG